MNDKPTLISIDLGLKVFRAAVNDRSSGRCPQDWQLIITQTPDPSVLVHVVNVDSSVTAVGKLKQTTYTYTYIEMNPIISINL